MQSVETLEEFVRQSAVALRLTVISCQIFKKTLHQGGEGGVELGGPQAGPLWKEDSTFANKKPPPCGGGSMFSPEAEALLNRWWEPSEPQG